MTIVTDIEREVVDLVPAARGVHWVVQIAIVVGVALIGWFVIDRLLFAPGRAHVAVETAKVDTKVASTQVATGKDAMATTEKIQVVHDRIEKVTHDNTIRILAAPGASDAVPAAVDGAWLSSICERDVYKDDLACKQPLAYPANR